MSSMNFRSKELTSIKTNVHKNNASRIIQNYWKTSSSQDTLKQKTPNFQEK